MEFKEKIQEIDEAKNLFMKWLEVNKADNVGEYEGGKGNNEWDYYRHISAFVGDDYYTVYFMMYEGNARIDYTGGDDNYNKMTVPEFLQLIS